MENLPNLILEWSDLFYMALWLGVVYLTLHFLSLFTNKNDLFGKSQTAIEDGLHYLMLVFEPLAMMLLLVVLVLINPVQNGILATIALVIGYQPIRNYVLGRIVLFDRSITEGTRIGAQNETGVIAKTDRLGLKIRTQKGLKFINYSKLLVNGYAILSGEQVSNLYELMIASQNEEKPLRNTAELMDHLATVPFLDWNNSPELRMSHSMPNNIKAKIMVRKSSHLSELIDLLDEWGYACKVSKK